MSFPVMPALPISMQAGLKKSPNWNTVKQKTVISVTSAIALKPYPTTDFELSMDSITGNEASPASVIESFITIYYQTQGGASLWNFTDLQDNTVATTNSAMLNVTPGAATPMGVTGDGTSKQFQLGRKRGGVVGEIIQQVNGSITVFINGSSTAAYTISSKGVITFTSAPANGAALTWSGKFYYPCRFADDTLDLLRSFTTNSGTDQWQVADLKFSSEYF